MKEREYYIDNIRVYLTALVIFHHAAVTYGGPGSWYYSEKPDGLVSGLALTVFVSTNQSFFMGMFFMLASYFIPSSYDRKGPLKFLLDRIKRLGIPLVFYSLVLAPVTIYLMITVGRGSEVSFRDYYLSRENWIDFGVLWFTAALLLFTILYSLTAFTLKSNTEKLTPPPSDKAIFIFALALGLISFFVRTIFPIGWTLAPVGFQLAHFTQYIALFIIGIVAFRNQWFAQITFQQGRRWKRVAYLLLAIGFPCIYALKLITHAELTAFLGGFTLQSFVNSVWEQLLGISIIIALLGIGRHKWNTQSNLMKELARSAYAVYIIHPIVLVAVSLLMKDIHLPTLLKFAVTGGVSVAVSFLIGYVLVRIPLINKVV